MKRVFGLIDIYEVDETQYPYRDTLVYDVELKSMSPFVIALLTGFADEETDEFSRELATFFPAKGLPLPQPLDVWEVFGMSPQQEAMNPYCSWFSVDDLSKTLSRVQQAEFPQHVLQTIYNALYNPLRIMGEIERAKIGKTRLIVGLEEVTLQLIKATLRKNRVNCLS